MYIQFDKSISANLRLHLTRTTHLVFSERALQSPSSLHRYLLLTSPEFSPLKQGARSSRAPRPCPRPATCMPHLPYVMYECMSGKNRVFQDHDLDHFISGLWYFFMLKRSRSLIQEPIFTNVFLQLFCRGANLRKNSKSEIASELEEGARERG